MVCKGYPKCNYVIQLIWQGKLAKANSASGLSLNNQVKAQIVGPEEKLWATSHLGPVHKKAPDQFEEEQPIKVIPI